ncbi:MAG TPA: hypothetical protein VF519_17870 [Mycobacteriales bacterium]
MNLRPIAAVATALACLVGTPATAADAVALDGVRATHATYDGHVNEAAYATEPVAIDTYPNRAYCTAESCDVTDVRLTLPKGSTAGRFRVTITTPPQLNAAVDLYNARGERMAHADLLENGGSFCCTDVPYLTVSFSVARLPAGRYTLVVFDRGGSGSFTADVDYKAYPPDRRRG